MRLLALTYLYRLLRDAKQSLSRAEAKPNAPSSELSSLEERIKILDYIIPIILKSEDDE